MIKFHRLLPTYVKIFVNFLIIIIIIFVFSYITVWKIENGQRLDGVLWKIS